MMFEQVYMPIVCLLRLPVQSPSIDTVFQHISYASVKDQIATKMINKNLNINHMAT
jgi:hypothetical protein